MKRILYNIASILLGLLFANSGLNKIFEYLPQPDQLPEELAKDTAALYEISWLIPLIAIVEILGGILIAIPKTRAVGVLTLMPIMVGITLVHTVVEPSGLLMIGIMWVIFLWIIYENKAKYQQLFL